MPTLQKSPDAAITVVGGPPRKLAQAKTAPEAPTAQQVTPAAAQAPAIAGGQELQVPTTKAEYEALLQRKSSLSDQLISAQDRRDKLARQLERSEGGVARSGLEERLRVLDERLVQLEKDIGTNSRLIALAPTRILTTSSSQPASRGPFNGRRVDPTPIGVVFTLFVLSPIAVTMARNIWRRGSRRSAPPAVNPQNDARMERVEQAVDAIAIEVERMNEGQRFLTQLLSKQQGMPALGVGQAPAEPIRVPHGDAVPVGAEGRRSY